MRVAMGVLAFGALFAGLVQIPGSTTSSTDSRAGLEASPLARSTPRSADYIGLGIGGVIALLGIGIAYLLYVARPELPGS